MEFPIELRKVWALTKKDFYDWSSYKMQAITTILAAGVAMASWGFNASFRNTPVSQYGSDFVSFLVVGVLVGGIMLALGQGLDRRLKPWILETVLMMGMRTPTFVLGVVAWTYMLSLILFIPQVLFSVYVIGAHFNVNFVSLALAIVISTGIVFSLSMIATGLRLVTKVTDPVTWGLSIAQQVLAGMTFPVQHLDNYLPGLSQVSWFLPQTWIYHIMRLATLSGGSVLDPAVGASFAISSGVALVLFPIALYVFRWGLKRAKMDGTLGWY